MRRLIPLLGTVSLLATWGAAAVAPAARAAGATVHDTIASYRYSPNPLTVHVGDTIVWTNEDDAPHTVTSSSAPVTLDSPELGKGRSWTYTATTAGTYQYYCTIHPYMRATLVVLPAASAPAASTHATQVAPAAPSDPTASDAPAAQGVPLVTTTSTTSPGGTHINPLLFLLAVVAGIVVVCSLAVAGAGASAARR